VKRIEKREKKYAVGQTSRLEEPENHQQHHSNEKSLALTVLLLFAHCKTRYWLL
jgi:hypothetical protein